MKILGPCSGTRCLKYVGLDNHCLTVHWVIASAAFLIYLLKGLEPRGLPTHASNAVGFVPLNLAGKRNAEGVMLRVHAGYLSYRGYGLVNQRNRASAGHHV